MIFFCSRKINAKKSQLLTNVQSEDKKLKIGNDFIPTEQEALLLGDWLSASGVLIGVETTKRFIDFKQRLQRLWKAPINQAKKELTVTTAIGSVLYIGPEFGFQRKTGLTIRRNCLNAVHGTKVINAVALEAAMTICHKGYLVDPDMMWLYNSISVFCLLPCIDEYSAATRKWLIGFYYQRPRPRSGGPIIRCSEALETIGWSLNMDGNHLTTYNKIGNCSEYNIPVPVEEKEIFKHDLRMSIRQYALEQVVSNTR